MIQAWGEIVQGPTGLEFHIDMAYGISDWITNGYTYDRTLRISKAVWAFDRADWSFTAYRFGVPNVRIGYLEGSTQVP